MCVCVCVCVCVCLSSTGVLKSGAVQFDPPLPTAKHTAIERLGVGLLNKCFVCAPFSEISAFVLLGRAARSLYLIQ